MDTYEILGDSSNRAEWLTLRELGIGASEMPSVMGANKYEAALHVYARKKGFIHVDPDESPSESAYWGLRLERIVAEEFTLRTGIEHVWCGLLLQSKRYPWALCTLDALTNDAVKDRPLECKTATEYFKGHWSEGVPAYYRIQAHQQMLVTGRDECRVACLIGGQKFVWDVVERDEALIARIIAAGEEFTDRLRTDNPPPPDASDSASDALEAVYATQSGIEVELSDEFDELDLKLAEMRDRKRVLEQEIDDATNRIRAALGTAEIARLPSGVTYRTGTVTLAERTLPATSYTRMWRKNPPKPKRGRAA